MTTTTTSRPATAGPRTIAYAGGGLAAAAAVIVAGNTNLPKGESGGLGPALVTAVACLVAGGLLFGVVLPRVRRIERTTIVCGALSVASLLVFWSGLTPVLAAATLAIADRGAQPRGAAKTLRALAVVAGLLALGWTFANSHLF